MTVMNIRRLIPTVAVAGATALGVVALSACGGSNATDGGKDGGKLDVVASFYPMQFLAKQIGGDHISAASLTKPGVEPHDLEITPQQTAQLSEADVVVYFKGLQPAVDDAVSQSDVRTKIDATTLTTLEGHDSEIGHEHEEEHAGEESSADPHVWLDPVKYAEVAEGIAKALQKADPDHAADYRKNSEKLVGKLDTLNTEFKDGLKNTRTKTFITTHSAFGYLAERYGLEQEGIAGIDPGAEPSPARMKELQETAERENVTTVFFETLASDKIAKTLAEDADLKTDVLDSLEGITSKSRGNDYFEVMRANLAALEKALGGK
jgi:zinc transport system substrate-binding protein